VQILARSPHERKMKYFEFQDQVHTKTDFDRFMHLLRQDWNAKHILSRRVDGADTTIKESGWENPYLPDFLDALQAWVNDSRTLPKDFPYHQLAKILSAAVSYE